VPTAASSAAHARSTCAGSPDRHGAPPSPYGLRISAGTGPLVARGIPSPAQIAFGGAAPAACVADGLAGRGSTIYAAFFGGTTKQGPEIRAYTAQGRVSKQLVRSAVPLIGVGLQGPWLYLGDVSGSIYRVGV
jgi:hypothetical protein